MISEEETLTLEALEFVNETVKHLQEHGYEDKEDASEVYNKKKLAHEKRLAIWLVIQTSLKKMVYGTHLEEELDNGRQM